MRHQLRRYQITPGKMKEFIAAWSDGVVPLRREFGFEFHGAWVNEESDEFVWVISHDHPDGFAEMDRAYYASPQRSALDPDPAQYIESGHVAMVSRVL